MPDDINLFKLIRKQIKKAFTEFFMNLNFIKGTLYFVVFLYLISYLSSLSFTNVQNLPGIGNLNNAPQNNYIWGHQVIQSIGSIATALAIIITLNDIKRRSDFEHQQLNIEKLQSRALIIPQQIEIYGKSDNNSIHKFTLDEINPKIDGAQSKCWTRSTYNIISGPPIFALKNIGKGPACDIKLQISKSRNFEDYLTVTETTSLHLPNDQGVIAHKEKTYDDRHLKFDHDFFIKITYSSEYVRGEEVCSKYKAHVVQYPDNNDAYYISFFERIETNG